MSGNRQIVACQKADLLPSDEAVRGEAIPSSDGLYASDFEVVQEQTEETGS